jgi:hypothetical protein
LGHKAGGLGPLMGFVRGREKKQFSQFGETLRIPPMAGIVNRRMFLIFEFFTNYKSIPIQIKFEF